MGDTLHGRVVLVTGSSRGIGAAIATRAAAQGATVAVHYKSFSEGADKTARAIRDAGGQAEVFCADVSVGAQAEQLVEDVVAKLGRLDGLVNNAGNTQVGPFLDITPDVWDDVIATDLSASFHTCRAAIPHMLEQGGGAIVNIASRLAQMGVTETAAYSAAKAGLVGLTRSLAKEFGTRGIRVNAVAPFVIVTDMTTDLVDSEAGKSRLRDSALGRFGRPEEVADTVLFLLSDAASLYTGQTLNPNAGAYMP
jgi:3-oxoacyl-[acyl-carrier protein] reductase